MTLFRFRRPRAMLHRPGGRSCRFVAVMLAALALIRLIPGAEAEPRHAPNSHISLDLDESFTPSDRFSGFVDRSSGASFVIIELPGPQPYDELKTIPEREDALAQQGLTETVVSALPGRTGEYVYFSGKRVASGRGFAKFILIFREAGLTATISVNVPQAAIDDGTYTRAQIESILATAKVEDRPAKSAELFRFGYLGPFQEAYSLGGMSKAYSTSGKVPAAGENRMFEEPTLFVSPSLGTQIVDPRTAAQRSFRSLGGLREKTIESEKTVKIGGLEGYQIIGETADKETGTEIAINLVLLVGDPGDYYAMVATMPLTDKDKFMPEIEKVIASFEPVKPEH